MFGIDSIPFGSFLETTYKSLKRDMEVPEAHDDDAVSPSRVVDVSGEFIHRWFISWLHVIIVSMM